MNEQEKATFKKLASWVVGELSEELSCRGCNDIDEKSLNLTSEEREIAIKYLNHNSAEDEYKENINADFFVNDIVSNMLDVFFGQQVLTNDKI